MSKTHTSTTVEEKALQHAYPATQYGSERVVSVERVKEILTQHQKELERAIEEERQRYARSLPNNSALITIEVRQDAKIIANKKMVSINSVELSEGQSLLLESERCVYEVLQTLTPTTSKGSKE